MDHKAEDEELPDLMMNINNDEEAKNDSREFEPVILHINNTLNGLVVFSSTVSKKFEEFVINGALSNEFDRVVRELDKPT